MDYTKEEDHAREQAGAQMSSIKEMVSRLKHAQECNDNENCTVIDTMTSDEINEYHDIDSATNFIQEDPLEIVIGKDFQGNYTYMILLCTGGPAVRIIGTLGGYDMPDTATLEYQNWGTPWTEYREADEDVLIEYASCFYWDPKTELVK